MKQKAIPADVHKGVEQIVKNFNTETLSESGCCYVARIKGKYLYLALSDGSHLSPRCRLTYTGKMDGWEFALSIHGDEKYDAEEADFPGSDHLDGTIVGAMKAALEAYGG